MTSSTMTSTAPTMANSHWESGGGGSRSGREGGGISSTAKSVAALAGDGTASTNTTTAKALISATLSAPVPPAAVQFQVSKRKTRKAREQDLNREVTALQDLVAGGIAGSASIVVGHPFDTIKVRLQTSAPGTGGTAGANGGGGGGVGIGGAGGIRSLFRGIGAPLSTAAVVNAVIFASFGASCRIWSDWADECTPSPSEDCVPDGHDQRERRQQEQVRSHHESIHGVISTEGGVFIEHGPRETHDELGKNFACGAFAGLVQSSIVCPMEHVKCRLQVQQGTGGNVVAATNYSGPWDATKSIVRHHGFRGLYRGMVSTCWREVPGFGVYFSSFDLVRDEISARWGYDDDDGADGAWMPSVLAGGVAGSVTWAITYPFDVIKSRIQVSSFDAPKESLKMSAVARRLVAEYGYMYLYRGFGVTLARAFPVNAILFPVYGFALRQLQGAAGTEGDENRR